MEETPAPTAWQWVTVEEACELLKLSAATIRRRIRDGEAVTLSDGSALVLEAERQQRPQGTRFVVKLPAALPVPAPRPPVSETPDASADASTITTAIQPLVVALEAANARATEYAVRASALETRLDASRAEVQRLTSERDRAVREAANAQTLMTECQDEYQGTLNALSQQLELEKTRTRELEVQLARRSRWSWGWMLEKLGVASPA